MLTNGLDAGLPRPCFFHRIGLLLNCCHGLIFPLWVKDLKYCINYIWLKCLDWNILHSTYDKTALDVMFCEGGRLLWSLLAVFMINLHNSDCKIWILDMELTYFEFLYIVLLWAVFDWHGLVLSRRPGNPGCMEQSRLFQCRTVAYVFQMN